MRLALLLLSLLGFMRMADAAHLTYVFRRQDGKIVHFWGTELPGNHVDTVWPYWNLMDFTPEGRPDIPTPPQNFRSEFLEKHYLNKE
jgi:predicted dithiol-disulfide oxidoreductase (DUF899 family)